jgi:hypothetical protein
MGVVVKGYVHILGRAAVLRYQEGREVLYARRMPEGLRQGGLQVSLPQTGGAAALSEGRERERTGRKSRYFENAPEAGRPAARLTQSTIFLSSSPHSQTRRRNSARLILNLRRKGRSPPHPYISSGGISPRSFRRAFTMRRGSHAIPSISADLGGRSVMDAVTQEGVLAMIWMKKSLRTLWTSRVLSRQGSPHA